MVPLPGPYTGLCVLGLFAGQHQHADLAGIATSALRRVLLVSNSVFILTATCIHPFGVQNVLKQSKRSPRGLCLLLGLHSPDICNTDHEGSSQLGTHLDAPAS